MAHPLILCLTLARVLPSKGSLVNRWLWRWVVLGLVAAAQLLALATMFYFGRNYGIKNSARFDWLYDLSNGVIVYTPLVHAALSVDWISKARKQGEKIPMVALWSRFQGCALVVLFLSAIAYSITLEVRWQMTHP